MLWIGRRRLTLWRVCRRIRWEEGLPASWFIRGEVNGMKGTVCGMAINVYLYLLFLSTRTFFFSRVLWDRRDGNVSMVPAGCQRDTKVCFRNECMESGFSRPHSPPLESFIVCSISQPPLIFDDHRAGAIFASAETRANPNWKSSLAQNPEAQPYARAW